MTTGGSGRIDLGGRSLAYQALGDGWPTVLLETGLGADSEEWAAVQDGAAAFTRVLRYDRAGRGASEPAAAPRSAQDLLDDLHALLHTPGMREGPCVLAGHSFGGLLARLYAQRHPRDVAALVLVEAMHEDQFDRLAPAFPPPAGDEGPALTAMRGFWCGGWREPAQNAEGIALEECLAQAREAGSLGALPLRVISAGSYLGRKLFGAEDGERLQARWGELQIALAGLSSDVEHVVVETSGHFVQRDAPGVVVQALRALVERLRAVPSRPP